MSISRNQLFQQVWEQKLDGNRQFKYCLGANQRVDAAAKILGPGERLLDVGCGSGTLGMAVSGKFHRVFGVDVADSAVEVASKNGVIASRVDLNCETLPFEAEFFDAVAFLSAIAYIYDPYDALRECHRVLKKNGMLVLTSANMRTFGKLFKIAIEGRFPTTSKGVRVGYDGGALHYFCAADLIALLTRAQFEVVDKQGIFYKPRHFRFFERVFLLRGITSEFLAGEILVTAKKV